VRAATRPPPDSPDASASSYITAAWLSPQVSQYDFAAGQFSYATGHVTQMLWAGSTGLGCGAARCAFGNYYVCHYSPPGNVIGQFTANVFAP